MNIIDVSATAITDAGKVRTNNEDNISFDGVFIRSAENTSRRILSCQNSTRHFSCAVFDGMGGEAFGEVASEMAASVFSDFFKVEADSLIQEKKKLCEFYAAANEKILLFSDEIKATTGCTAVTLNIVGDKAVISNIGDSKIFLIRNGHIEQLSDDHTLSSLMIRSGAMTEDQAKNSLGSHTLLRFLGAPPDEFDFNPYFGEEIALAANDYFILCSDGLTDMVSPSEMLRWHSEVPEPQGFSQKLLDEALANGGRDNCTIIVVRITFASLR